MHIYLCILIFAASISKVLLHLDYYLKFCKISFERNLLLYSPWLKRKKKKAKKALSITTSDQLNYLIQSITVTEGRGKLIIGYPR